MESSPSPRGYQYRLAVYPSDFRQINDARRQNGETMFPVMGHPTVICRNEAGEIIGALGTIKRAGIFKDVAIPIAGNLFLSKGAAFHRMVNIFSAYDNAMLLSGVAEYAFFVLNTDVQWLAILSRIAQESGPACRQLHEVGNELVWFHRIIRIKDN